MNDNDNKNIMSKANALMVQGRFSEAIPPLLESYKYNPTDTNTLLCLGVSETKVGNFDKAKTWLEKASDLNSKNPACYLYLANIQMQKQEIDNSIENYRKAISLQPDLPIAHLYLASLLMSTKQLEEAEYHYNYVINLQPDNADAYANLAQVLELSNKIKDARKSVDKALKIAPGHIGALLALGKIEKRDKNYSKAENIFKKIVSLSKAPPVTAMASLELGHCLDKLEKYDDAYAATLRSKKTYSDMAKNLPFDKTLYQEKIKRHIYQI